jgi:hypothetical protein
MGILQHTQDRLVLQSGGATLSFDKQARTAQLQRKGLFWKPKPLSEPLDSVAEVALDSGIDRASGVEICNTMIVFKNGAAWAFGANDKSEAKSNAETVRKFLGLP